MSMAGYSGTPLARKLGVSTESDVLIDGAPAGFALDEGRVHQRVGRGPYDVIVCFCPDQRRLTRRWGALHSATTQAGALWVAWPKRSSGVPTDLTEDTIREFALANGRVDVKVIAIDDVWSGLKLVIRKKDRT